MQLTNAPSKLTLAFAENGGKRTIPVASQSGGLASYNDGFPAPTRTPISSGGVPPSGLDMNGILNQISRLVRWVNAGGVFPFDAAFAKDPNVSGYPKGARVLSSDGLSIWINTVDGNTTNPDANGASGWLPADGNKATSVYASTAQTLTAGSHKIAFNAVEYDGCGQWNSVARRFVSVLGGKHRLSGAITIPSCPAGAYAIDVYKNGAFLRRCNQYPQVSEVDLTFNFSTIVSAISGDYFEIYLMSAQVAASAVIGLGSGYVYAQFEYMGR